MQNDLVHSDGPNGKSPLGAEVQKRHVVSRTVQAITKARAAGVAVAFVRVGFSPDYKECPAGSKVFSGAPKAGLFKLGSWGTEIHTDLAPQASDAIITKHRVSPFFSTRLEVLLSAQG